jgi:hypothetical protein
MQATIGAGSVMSGLYGYRMYFFMIPLAFIIGETFKGRDLARLARITAITTIPMALIVFAQYRSPPDSFVNKLIGAESAAYLYAGVARASGTFAFTQGHELYCQIALAVILAILLLPPESRPVSKRLLIATALATAINVLLDGNRGVFLLCFITYVCSVVFRLFCERSGKNASLFRRVLPEILLLAGAILYLTAFTQSFEAMRARVISGEEDKGGNAGRVNETLVVGTAMALNRVSVLGHGVGLGTAGGRQLAGSSGASNDFVFDENELSRVIDESGLAGMLYLGLRFWFVAVCSFTCLIASKRSGNPFPLLIVSIPMVLLTVQQLSMNGTTCGFGWFFTGVALAAGKMKRK